MNVGKGATIAYRLWSKVNKDGPIPTRRPDLGPCWLWTGYTLPRGYGRIWDGSRLDYAHRVAYELTRGPIPEGLTIDHLCFTPGCCNPDHLEVATYRVNVLRSNNTAAQNVLKTHCKRGHEFTPENTINKQCPSGQPGRECRICHSMHVRAYQQRQAERRTA